MKYFKDSEFACNCGCGLNNITQDVKDRLDAARGYAGIPFHISSGSRCPTWNAKSGGAKTSAHRTGEAVDIYCISSIDRYTIVAACIKAGFTGIDPEESYVHVDMKHKVPCLFRYRK